MPVVETTKTRTRAGAAPARTLARAAATPSPRVPVRPASRPRNELGHLIGDLVALARLECTFGERARAVRAAEDEAGGLRGLVDQITSQIEAEREALALAPVPRGEEARAARGRRASLQAERAAALRRLAGVETLARQLTTQRNSCGTRVQAQRRALTARLSADMQRAFEAALRSGRQPAVAPIDGSFCSGCRLRLPASMEQQLRHSRQVGSCPQCRRVLYDPAWLG